MILNRHQSRIDLDWMQPEDDDGIRRLLRELAMDGEIRLAVAREPSFAGALCVEGESHDVLVGRERESGNVVGLGTRSTKCTYVNGITRPIGYLGGLRAHPAYRHGRDFFRAYKLMHEAHRDRPVSIHLTSILEENTRAIRLLTSGRMNLPSYCDLGRFHTLCYAPRQYSNRGTRNATEADRKRILAFMHEHGPKQQFFPAYQESDWGSSGGLLRDLDWTDMLLVEEGTKLVGCLGLWDQRGFRQAVVDGYGPRYRTMRPLWNVLSPVHRRPRLPVAGKTVNGRMVAAMCIAGDDSEIFARLLRAALTRAWDDGAEQVAVGLHEHHKLLPAAQQLPHVTIDSRIYAVAWPEDGDPRDVLDDRAPYLELGGL